MQEYDSEHGIEIFDDICCGSDYLEAVKSGLIGKDDMVVSFSEDRAQIYRNKESGTLYGIMSLLDLPASMRFKTNHVFPVLIVGGPNNPKNHDSFIFPTFHHLAASQNAGIQIWDSSMDRILHLTLSLHLALPIQLP